MRGASGQTRDHLRRRHDDTRRQVLEGAPTFTLNGRNVAGVGHQVLCPRCKGIFPILPDLLGRRYPHTIGERDTAVEGMRTACGAELIASQGTGTIDDVGAGERGDGGSPGGSAAVAAAAVAPSPTLCLECLKAAAKNAATMVARG
ncbi:PAAR motif-containing protein [Burkholderia pseudomallei]|nr:PAAR motif-containing protein [Burkholderia pseudomallei]